jgi:hypothetical protein
MGCGWAGGEVCRLDRALKADLPERKKTRGGTSSARTHTSRVDGALSMAVLAAGAIFLTMAIAIVGACGMPVSPRAPSLVHDCSADNVAAVEQ